MVNFIRDHKNWCRTCTPFEKELRRYFHWEESEKVSTDVEHILHLRRSWEGFSIWEGWIFSNILIWEGIEKVFFLRRTWEAWAYYRIVEMDLRRWEVSEKEMYPPQKTTRFCILHSLCGTHKYYNQIQYFSFYQRPTLPTRKTFLWPHKYICNVPIPLKNLMY